MVAKRACNWRTSAPLTVHMACLMCERRSTLQLRVLFSSVIRYARISGGISIRAVWRNGGSLLGFMFCPCLTLRRMTLRAWMPAFSPPGLHKSPRCEGLHIVRKRYSMGFAPSVAFMRTMLESCANRAGAAPMPLTVAVDPGVTGGSAPGASFQGIWTTACLSLHDWWWRRDRPWG
jgi:hypothetical protein